MIVLFSLVFSAVLVAFSKDTLLILDIGVLVLFPLVLVTLYVYNRVSILPSDSSTVEGGGMWNFIVQAVKEMWFSVTSKAVWPAFWIGIASTAILESLLVYAYMEGNSFVSLFQGVRYTTVVDKIHTKGYLLLAVSCVLYHGVSCFSFCPTLHSYVPMVHSFNTTPVPCSHSFIATAGRNRSGVIYPDPIIHIHLALDGNRCCPTRSSRHWRNVYPYGLECLRFHKCYLQW